jgi:hypothetical protein
LKAADGGTVETPQSIWERKALATGLSFFTYHCEVPSAALPSLKLREGEQAGLAK